jgi:TPR repeat protein
MAVFAMGGIANATDFGPALVDAVTANDPTSVSELIQLGADVGATDKNGWTPLAVAAELDEPEVATLLINSGASPWTPDRTTSPIAIAAAFGSSGVIEPLLSKGLPPVIFNDTLSVAATRGDSTTVEQLTKSANLSLADIDDLKKSLMARFKVDLPFGGDIDPRVALLGLKACREDGVYEAERCISPQSVHSQLGALEVIPPQDCDLLAAAPTDSDRPLSVKPVYFQAIDASKAVTACMRAIATYSKTPRFALELGRAYWAQKNYVDGDYYMRKAADMGSKFALTELSFAYSTGARGLPKDAEKAARLLAKAADLGDLPGLTQLGSVYLAGRGVTQDTAKALAFYRLAAERGGVDAMVNMGMMYCCGIGVKKDMPTAFYWFRRAADAGFLPGIRTLGFMYQLEGTNKNLGEAKRLYEQAEAGGDQNATVALQLMAAGAKLNSFGAVRLDSFFTEQ